jgi:hypothetical protein
MFFSFEKLLRVSREIEHFHSLPWKLLVKMDWQGSGAGNFIPIVLSSGGVLRST